MENVYILYDWVSYGGDWYILGDQIPINHTLAIHEMDYENNINFPIQWIEWEIHNDNV